MHSGKQDPLLAFTTEGMATVNAPKFDDSERQLHLKERAAVAHQWRRYINAQASGTVVPPVTGTDLASLREAFGLSQADCADIVGLDVATITAAEEGSRTFGDAALARFANAARNAIQEGA